MSNDFLSKFEDSLSKLSNINDIINKNIQSRSQFTKTVYDRLVQINGKIKSLTDNIIQLKQKLLDLQKIVDDNRADISANNSKSQSLQKNNEDLLVKQQNLEKILQNLQQQYNTDTKRLQDLIDAKEGELQQQQQKYDTLQENYNALQRSADSKKDAEKKLTDELNNLKARMSKLESDIADKDNRINQLTENLRNETANVSEHANNLETQTAQTQQQIATLNARIQELEKTNENYVARIISATQAINEASDNLKTLSDNTINDGDISKVNDVFNDIEKSIASISNALNLNSSMPQNQKNPLLTNKFNILRENITLTEFSEILNEMKNNNSNTTEIETINNVTKIVNDIKNYYLNKSNISNDDLQRIKSALENAITSNGLKEKYEKGVSDYNSIFNYNSWGFGGKKTHKKKHTAHKKKHTTHKKKRSYKGGYTYKNVKRTTLKTL